MDTQGIVQCLDNFLKKVFDFLHDGLATERLSSPVTLKKLELIDNLEFMRFYHDPVTLMKALVQKSNSEKNGCPCRRGSFRVLSSSKRVVDARISAFSNELQQALARVSSATDMRSLSVHRRDFQDSDMEGWLTRAGDSRSKKCYAVLEDSLLALFDGAGDPDELATATVVLSDKFVLEEASPSGGYEFTVCGGGDRLAFQVRTHDEMKKWTDHLAIATRLKFQELIDKLKSPEGKADTRHSAFDRQRPPPDGASSDAVASCSVNSASPKFDRVTRRAATESTPNASSGRWFLDVPAFSVPMRPRSKHYNELNSDNEPRHVSASKSSPNLCLSTSPLLGSPSSVAKSMQQISLSDDVESSDSGASSMPGSSKKHPKGGVLSVKLRSKRSATVRRAQSLVIENNDGAILLTSDMTSGGRHENSIGSRISRSASLIFGNLSVSRSVLRSSGRAVSKITKESTIAEIEGMLHHKNLLKWSKVYCRVVRGVLYGYKDAESVGHEPSLQLSLAGNELALAEESKVKRLHALKLTPHHSKSVYFAASDSEELRRWFDAIEKYSAKKSASVFPELLTVSYSDAQEMSEIREEEERCNKGDSSLLCSQLMANTNAEIDAACRHDDCLAVDEGSSEAQHQSVDADWPDMFSESQDLMSDLSFLAGPSEAKRSLIASQQGVTLPSPSTCTGDRNMVLIETEGAGNFEDGEGLGMDSITWLTPASPVRVDRLNLRSDGSSSTDAGLSEECSDNEVDKLQLSLDRRKEMLDQMVREKERLQEVLASEQQKYCNKLEGSDGSKAAGGRTKNKRSSAGAKFEYHRGQLTADEQNKSKMEQLRWAGKLRGSSEDITALKQQMEGLKDKMRDIDKGLRQSLVSPLPPDNYDDDLVDATFTRSAQMKRPEENGAFTTLLPADGLPQTASLWFEQANSAAASDTKKNNLSGKDHKLPALTNGDSSSEIAANHEQTTQTIQSQSTATRNSRMTASVETTGNTTSSAWNGLRALIDSLDGEQTDSDGLLFVYNDV